jgi:hypothetical protein
MALVSVVRHTYAQYRLSIGHERSWFLFTYEHEFV